MALLWLTLDRNGLPQGTLKAPFSQGCQISNFETNTFHHPKFLQTSVCFFHVYVCVCKGGLLQATAIAPVMDYR